MCTSVDFEGTCVSIPVVSDECNNFTGGLSILNKETSSAQVPGGFICTFFESVFEFSFLLRWLMVLIGILDVRAQDLHKQMRLLFKAETGKTLEVFLGYSAPRTSMILLVLLAALRFSQ